MSIPEAAKPFNEHAKEYDSWYDIPPLFDIEIEAIRAATTKYMSPGLEVGVGPGRFAQALGIEFGLDPALSPLQLASGRSIITINGIGENLPVRTQSIGTVYLFFTLCFLTDPAAVFREISRVLKPGGFMVIGLIPARSEWGKHLTRKSRENHLYYRHAHFRTITETTAMLERHGFQIHEAWSTLFQPPTRNLSHEHPHSGAHEEAGFCVLTIIKKGENIGNC